MERIHSLISSIATSAVRSTCQNGTVIHAILVRKSSKKKTSIPYTEILKTLLENHNRSPIVTNSLLSKTRKVFARYTNLIKCPTKNFEAISLFLIEEFSLPISPIPSSSSSADKDAEGINASLSPQIVTTPTKIVDPNRVFTPSKTRHDCGNCSTAKKINFKLNDSLKKIEKSQRQQKHQLKSIQSNFNRKNKVVQQKLKRKANKNSEFKTTVRLLEIQKRDLERKKKKLVTENSSLKRQSLNQSKRIEKLVEEKNLLQDKLHETNENLSQMTRYSEDLEGQIHDNCNRTVNKRFTELSQYNNVLCLKKGKMYDSEIRRLVYHKLICDVPVRHCGELIRIFFQLFMGKSLVKVPSSSTCAQMGYELSILSTIQLMEFILGHKRICLSWDATTIDGRHVNEIHLTVNTTNCLVLDVRHLAGGKSSDYVGHVVSALSEAAEIYARFIGRQSADVLFQLKSAISVTLTDRAPVNACVTRQLCTELDHDIMQLYCNVHPLDSMARDVKRSLVKIDKMLDVRGQCYGSEGAAVNLINAISVLRFKDGKGDPVGFKNFLKENELALGTFTRYVGNRMHVLFHLAGIIILHEKKLKTFLETQSTAAGLLRSKILQDLKNESIVVQIWALGFVGKLVTGPWMTKFYSSKKSNLEMIPDVKRSASILTEWINAPQDLLQDKSYNYNDVFGCPINKNDEVFSALVEFSPSEVDIQMSAFSSALKECLGVIKRQISNFLTAETPSIETLEKTAPAPTNNMASERALGCLDKMWRRAPVATSGFLNGKVKSKLNKCTEWLDKKNEIERERIISFAVHEARDDRLRKSIIDKTVSEEIGCRRKIIATERMKKRRNKIMRHVTKAIRIGNVNEVDLQSCRSGVTSDIDEACFNQARDMMASYLNTPESLIGMLIIHVVDNMECYARIYRTVSNHMLVAGYWDMNEVESSCVDHRLSASAFFTDAILGLLKFL